MLGWQDLSARCSSWSYMILREPINRCSTASSRTAHSLGGLARSKIACRSIRALDGEATQRAGVRADPGRHDLNRDAGVAGFVGEVQQLVIHDQLLHLADKS